MTSSILTSDQQHASDQFFNFLMSDETEFMISGAAGCGKTFLMTHLVKEVMENYKNACKIFNIPIQYKGCAFTATTNKAAEVLEHSLNESVSTIHSFLGLRVYDDYKTGKTKISQKRDAPVYENLIIFIDEWSMIDSQIYSFIKENIINSKIVYVGDHAQMSPVGEQKSPLVDAIDPSNFVHLSKPIRNANTPALVDLCAQLRNTVETGKFSPIKGDGQAIRYLNDDEMQEKLCEYFKDPNPSCRVLCYTNERTRLFNEYIRQDVRGQSEKIQIGDVLVVAQTLTAGKNVLNVEREVIVKDIGKIQSDPRFEGEFEDGTGIQYRDAVVECLNGNRMQCTVRIPLKMDRITACKKHFAKLKDWSTWFNLKNSYADLRDKSACTVYKSQGSTYDAVFIDLSNISESHDPQQVARMLYVAASRARNNVYLYGYLSKRYQGEMAA